MRLVAILCALLAISYGQAIWGGGDGTWNSATSWIGGLPTDSAIINATGLFLVTINSPVTLINSLTLGGSGSFPNLFINGSSLTVPTLNLLSGTLTILNGTVSVGGKILVNASDTVVINVVSGSIQSLIGGTEIVRGQLQLVGHAALADSYTISPESTLLLTGSHTASSCQFSGYGTISLSGTLNLANDADCSVQNNAFIIDGGFLNSTATSTADFASLIINGNSTIQGIQVQANIIALISGSLNIATSASLTVQILNTTFNVFTILGPGQFNVSQPIYLPRGILVLQSTIFSAKVYVDSTNAQLVINNTQLLSAFIESTGTVTFDGLNSVTNNVTFIGGRIYFISTLIVQSGSAYFSQNAVQGNIIIQAGAKATFDNVAWTDGRINNTGNLILTGTTQYSGDFYYDGASNSTLTATGPVNSDGTNTFHFSGQGSIGGSYHDGTISIEGSFATSADFNVYDAPFQIVGGALSAVKGNIMATNDIIVTKSGVLIANATAMNISTNGSLVVGASSQVIVQGSLFVASTLQLSAQSTLIVAKGYATSTALAMDAASKYVVTVFSNTTSRVLNVINNAQLSGSLEVDVDASFTFGAGQTQTVMTYGAHTGTFATFSIKRDPDSVNYGTKNATVTRGMGSSSSGMTSLSSGMESDASVSQLAILPIAFLAYFL